MDELWGAFWEDFGENWPRYKGTAMNMAEDEVLIDIFIETALRQQQYLATCCEFYQ